MIMIVNINVRKHYIQEIVGPTGDRCKNCSVYDKIMKVGTYIL